MEPVAAGLFPHGHGFDLAWAPASHSTTCPAFSGKAPNEPAEPSQGRDQGLGGTDCQYPSAWHCRGS